MAEFFFLCGAETSSVSKREGRDRKNPAGVGATDGSRQKSLHYLNSILEKWGHSTDYLANSFNPPARAG